MRKWIAFALSLIMITTLAACGTKEDQPPEIMETPEELAPETTEVVEETIFAILEAKNCFYDAGFVELIDGAEESSEYTFTTENSEATQWCVYILDQAFDDGFRYIAQAAEPVLIGDGTAFVHAGQYVYVYCSANEFTTGVVDESAKLNVTIK